MKRFILAGLLCGMAAWTCAAGVIWESFDSEVGSRWSGTAGKANGIWDGTKNRTLAPAQSGSMRIQRTPTITEPRTRITELAGVTSQTVVTIHFYDDGDDIKWFNVMLKTKGEDNRISIGLRDDVVGSDTPYVFEANGVISNTGVMRSTGWHKVEFGFEPGVGVEARVDGFGWTGNTFGDAAYPDWFQFQTEQGAGANNVWIDDIGVETDARLSPKNSVEGWLIY